MIRCLKSMLKSAFGVHFRIEVGVSSIVINFREDIVIHFPEETGRMRLGNSALNDDDAAFATKRSFISPILNSIRMIFGRDSQYFRH